MSTRITASLVLVCIGIALASPGWARDGKKQAPCPAPEHSQFDFWVGERRVTDEAGEFQGTNRVEKILDGCIIQENWTGASGMRGHSINIYAKGRGVWHQTWVDSHGILLLLDGRLEGGGRMVLRGETPSKDGGGTIEHEISWEPLRNERVPQVWKISKDGGAIWNEAFAKLYTRQAE